MSLLDDAVVVALIIAGLVGLAALGVCACFGRRALLTPFRIRRAKMTVARLGLGVDEPQSVARVNEILQNFLGGFNSTITGRSISAASVACDAVPVLYRPFAHEGMAMGYTLHKFFRYDPTEFESAVVRPRPQYRYLYYVGLGFWSGMRNHPAARIERIAQDLDPLHRYLCFDGYGFKHAFFDYPRAADGLRPLQGLTGYARNAAYQGVGRAFFFLFMDRPDTLIASIRSLGVFATDAAAGVGLAMAFVNPDRLDYARELARKMPSEWHTHVHLGLCFGLKARSINDLNEFERNVAGLDSKVRDAIWTSIRECDRIELLVRAESGNDRYRRWRERVTGWMEANVRYPLDGLRESPSRKRDETEPIHGVSAYAIRAGVGAPGQ